MTGITRKDVRRVRLLIEDYAEDPRVQLSPLGDVLQLWCTDSSFLDESGKPRLLPFSGPGSFEQLVQNCASDLPAGAIKVELLKYGAIIEDAAGMLNISRREIIPEELDERLMTSIAFSLRALATTIAFNTDPQRKSPGRIERFVQSNNLTDVSRRALSIEVRTRIMTFTEELDDLLSRGSIVDAGDGGRRIGVGVFYHEDP